MSRELVQLEDLLKWSERGLTGGAEENEGAELVAEATLIREEANKVVQVSSTFLSNGLLHISLVVSCDACVVCGGCPRQLNGEQWWGTR